MPKITKVAWWCWVGHRNDPANTECRDCGSHRIERHANVHASERAVVYYNPATGEHRTPPRTDIPIPAVYATQGFERHEISNMTQWERQSGSVHEATNFNPGNEPDPSKADNPYRVSKQAKEGLIRDMQAAFASGPWTGHDQIVDSSAVAVDD